MPDLSRKDVKTGDHHMGQNWGYAGCYKTYVQPLASYVCWTKSGQMSSAWKSKNEISRGWPLWSTDPIITTVCNSSHDNII